MEIGDFLHPSIHLALASHGADPQGLHKPQNSFMID
jgi:hypothetical protein